MGKKGKESKTVIVPDAIEMDDETFLKHIELRHAEECKIENGKVARRAVTAWIEPWRRYHERLHAIAAPRQYDHEHDNDEELV